MALLAAAGALQAQIFGTVRGSVEDPQHMLVPNAGVKIKAQASSWEQQTHTDDQGHFTIPAVPAGVYTVEITSPGFRTVSQTLTVNIGSAPLLSFTLELASTSSDVQVSGVVDPVNAEASSPPVMVT
ncbi:MAG TPA: carboxypeptidase-like regulatory domain-containing protein, partial [Terriglobales bacterium]|nr:carboxypeptidase-like regulatory domain-containing protein [Terriglobales bacterium]